MRWIIGSASACWRGSWVLWAVFLAQSPAMLQWFVSGRAAKGGRTDKNIVYFDNLVIATKYIGPISAKPSPRAPKGNPGKQGVPPDA